MTVISALISEKGTAVASDSLLTAVLNGKRVHLEWTKSKIITLRKFRASISYWGFAGVLKSYDKKSKKATWHWDTYSWIAEHCKNPLEDNIEDFVSTLKDKLDKELKRIKFNDKRDSGIGLHITAFEYIDDYWIPELFLISNFQDTLYQKIGTLGYSRNTYHTITNNPPKPDHKNKPFRLEVKKYLMAGGLIWYNNGDPILYGRIARSIFFIVNTARRRNTLREFKSVKDTLPLVTRPIEIISEIQRDFYKLDEKIVGGRIHDLAVSPNGDYYSTSGDNKT